MSPPFAALVRSLAAAGRSLTAAGRSLTARVAAGPRGRLLAGRRPAATLSAGLALVLATAGVAGTTAAAGTGGDPGRRDPLTPERVSTLVAASRSCPTVGPARLAGQIMATSGFDTGARTARGGSGVAGLTDQEWGRWTPWPGADRADPAANVHALARHMCDLVGGVRVAAVPGDPWLNALAAFEAGLPDVQRQGGVPERAAGYVRTVAEHAAWYGVQPDLVAVTGPTSSRTVLAAGAAPPGGTGPATTGPTTTGPTTTGPTAGPTTTGPTTGTGTPSPPAPLDTSRSDPTGADPSRPDRPRSDPPETATGRPTADAARTSGGAASGTRTAAPPPPARPAVTEVSGGARVSAGGSIPGYGAGLVVDGDRDTYWEGPPGVFPQDVQLDLGRSRTVSSVVVRLPSEASWNSRTQEIAVSTAPDGGGFSTVAATAPYVFDVTKGNTVTIPLRVSSARYVRLTFVGTSGRQPWAPQAGEIIVYGT